ncbi:HNH endonuclease signature motif containing protein [Chromobacterium piscinae]|uniref:HNH endonuclease signature motif containing protein n=1 Tax=Chromobacterium piscinae TaxID=686831 RepID=UPI003F7FC5C6
MIKKAIVLAAGLESFSNDIIKEVWNKGKPINGIDREKYRLDQYGAIIRLSAYGDPESEFGWEIDHINPKAKGGTDDIDNLQPLFWWNNRSKGINPDPKEWACANPGYNGNIIPDNN